FGEAVRQRLYQNGIVVVLGPLEAFGDRHFLDARRHDEPTEIICLAARDRCDEVRERDIGLTVTLGELLAQREKRREFLRTTIVGEEPDVVADRIGGPEADHGSWRKPFLVDDLL